jgi:hypothetical protein
MNPYDVYAYGGHDWESQALDEFEEMQQMCDYPEPDEETDESL